MNSATSNWPEFQDAAAKIFHHWKHQRELKWAEHAWGKLSAAGLTECKLELDRTRACIRLMALGGIYMDFCDHAWGEDIPPEISAWVGYFDLTSFHVGRLFGRVDSEYLFREPPVWSPNRWCMEQACLFLMDSARVEIFRVLCPNPTADARNLYFALHQTRTTSTKRNAQAALEKTEENSRALKFVSDGCPRQRPYYEELSRLDR